jgi:hypothetical protein
VGSSPDRQSAALMPNLATRLESRSRREEALKNRSCSKKFETRHLVSYRGNEFLNWPPGMRSPGTLGNRRTACAMLPLCDRFVSVPRKDLTPVGTCSLPTGLI